MVSRDEYAEMEMDMEMEFLVLWSGGALELDWILRGWLVGMVG